MATKKLQILGEFGGSGAVDSVNGKTGAVTLTASDVGAATSNHSHTVANITDLTATATELNYMDGVTSAVQTQLNAKVPTSRTINGKALSSNITLSASDVGAAESGHSHSSYFKTYSAPNEVDPANTSGSFSVARTSSDSPIGSQMVNVSQFQGENFRVQLGIAVNPSTDGTRSTTAWIRDKHNSGSNTWSKWSELLIANKDQTITGKKTFNSSNVFDGEQKFSNAEYCPTITDTASGVGCAFKASRGLYNEALLDKIIMTATTGKIPFYKYTGTSGGSMTGLTEVASINSSGALTLGTALTIANGGTGATTAAAARTALGITPANIGAATSDHTHSGYVPTSRTINSKALSGNISLSASDVGALSARPASLEFSTASNAGHGGFIDFHFNGSSADYTSRIIESGSGTIAINSVSINGSTLSCGRINGSDEYLSGSLYVGGKSLTSDGKTGVAFGSSGDITMQGSSAPTLNFITGSNTSATNKIVAKSTEMIVYGATTLSMYTVQSDGSIYGVNTGKNYFRPNGTAATNGMTLGQDGRRFKTAYFSDSAIVLSDRNAKTDIEPIDERYVNLFDKLEPITYKLIGGNHDRDHIGFISQDVKASMDEVGLSDLEFGGYCRDAKLDPDTEQPILDENGDPVYSYSLRYGEFIALNTKMIQVNRATIAAQQEEINSLKAEIAELKEAVAALLNK